VTSGRSIWGIVSSEGAVWAVRRIPDWSPGELLVKTHLSIRVHGRVQGVFFRQTAKEQALRLGLTGFARNDPDGTVQIEVEGDPAAVERFLAWCEVGPRAARVERVETQTGELVGYAGFETR
jgi:acylphosphatase